MRNEAEEPVAMDLTEIYSTQLFFLLLLQD